MSTSTPTPLPSRQHGLTPHHLPTHPTNPTEFDLSPSKARAHATSAQTWSVIHTWLGRMYSPDPVPVFERNDVTRDVLLELMRENEGADRERRELDGRRREVLRRYEGDERGDEKEREVLGQIEADLSIDANGWVEELAKSAVKLGWVPESGRAAEDMGMVLGRRLMELTHQNFVFEGRVREMEELKSSFEREMENTKVAMDDLRGQQDDVEMENMHLQTAQWVRETKQIGLKLGEYKERITGLERFGQGEVLIEDVKDREKRLETKKNEVKRLEERLSEFNGLPPDIDASRVEVRRAQAELDELKKRRALLFQRLKDG